MSKKLREETAANSAELVTEKRERTDDDLSIEGVEQHYTVGQVARRLQLNYSTVLRMVKLESGVMQIGNVKSRKRTRITLRIPASVVKRMVESRKSGNIQ